MEAEEADISLMASSAELMQMDYRLEPELLFSREENAMLRLMQNYHSIGIQSSCRPAIYQVS